MWGGIVFTIMGLIVFLFLDRYLKKDGRRARMKAWVRSDARYAKIIRGAMRILVFLTMAGILIDILHLFGK